MRKLLRLLAAALLLLGQSPLFAQEREVNGTVLNNADNTPIPGVTVTNQNTNQRVQTNQNGYFSIRAQNGHVLVFTSVGFSRATATVTGDNLISVRMSVSAGELNSVEVTALGISRSRKSLGYATQQVKGEDIANSQRDNVITALAGRVAGVTVTTTTGLPGASSAILLRGAVSMDGNNQPLIVIDNLPVDNSTFIQGNLVSDGPNRNNDYSNRLLDLNPNDIESINVLKGPEATALYGNAGASGALIITTKKAKAGRSSIAYDNAFRLEKITRFPEIQQVYGRGVAGVRDPLSRVFLGPKYADTSTIYNNIETFFKTGFTQKHNLSVEAGSEKVTYRLSTNILDQEGIVPQTAYNRFSIRLTGNAIISPKIDISTSLNYVTSRTRKATKGQFGFLLSLLTWPSDDDVTRYLNPNGSRREISEGSTTEIDNPFWDVNRNKSEDKNERLIGGTTLTYKPTKWLTLRSALGVDQYSTVGFTFIHPESRNGIAANGNIETFTENSKLYSGQFTSIITKNINDFSNQLVAGFAFDQREYEVNAIRGERFYIPDYVSINNTDPTTQRTKSTLNRVRNVGWFAQVQTGYKDILFITLSGRYDGASTLVKPGFTLDDRTRDAFFFYPAGSLSFNFTELGMFKGIGYIDYGKLRFSIGKTGKTAKTPYVTASRYVPVQTTGGGFALSVFAGNPELTPEFTENYEIGGEMKFFKNRLGIDVAVYKMRSINQVVAPRLSYATGAILKWLNGGTVENKGIEIMLTGTPIKTKNTNWDITLNFDRNRNKITKMPADLPIFYISDYDILPFGGVKAFYRVGGSLSALGVEASGATSFLRNKDGKLLINPSNGLPVRDTVPTLLGERLPDFKMGFINNLRYKNWSLSMNFDIRVGGDVFNGNDLALNNIGLSKRTLDRETPRVIEGVLRDGLENTANPTPNTIIITPYFQNGYYNNIYNIEDYFERDINWVRLRDVTLSYNFSSLITKRQKLIKSGSIFVTGTDVFMLTNYTGVDPNVSALNASAGGYGGQGFDYGALALPVGINFGLRLGF
ncbi:MAG TPA: SusC/RagA family TonB-linked outer membrane protein [Chitinophagaceae bacterium]|nr:SusC/RagA family TonB-linked outer membrane protein [Chitinophagaceae bacterium]